ncbi:MAG: hypothetical protein ABIF40_00020 [archaeon]
MNKKGGYDYGRLVPYMFIVLVVIGLVFLTMASTFATYQSQSTMCKNELEKDLMVQELLYSPNCFVYVNEDIQRAYPGVIDLNKFNTDNLDSNCLTYIERNVRLTIGGIIVGDDMTEPETIVKRVLTYENGLFEMHDLTIEIEKSYDVGDCNE